MKKKLCKLCEKDYACSKHHIIPKSIVKKINPDSKLKDTILVLCENCHKEVHYSFVNHLIMTKRISGYNKLNAISYLVLKSFLRAKYITIWNEYRKHFKNFLEESMKEFMK